MRCYEMPCAAYISCGTLRVPRRSLYTYVYMYIYIYIYIYINIYTEIYIYTFCIVLLCSALLYILQYSCVFQDNRFCDTSDTQSLVVGVRSTHEACEVDTL